MYTHGKKLGNTSCVTTVNSRLNFFYNLNMYWQHYPIYLNLYYPKLLRCENCEYQAITAAGSGHRGYRSSISEFRAPFLFLAINSFHGVWLCSFCTSLKLTVSSTNFDHHHSISWPSSCTGGILDRWQVSMSHFFLCLYILQVVRF